MASLGTSEVLIIAVILLVLFGGARLPKLARSIGQARREIQAVEEESGKSGS